MQRGRSMSARTGADPVKLGIPGSDLPHVHYLRTVADSRAIIKSLGIARRAGAPCPQQPVAGSTAIAACLTRRNKR